jgi:hypothetical protein
MHVLTHACSHADLSLQDSGRTLDPVWPFIM